MLPSIADHKTKQRKWQTKR